MLATEHPPSRGLIQLLAAGADPNLASDIGHRNTPLITAAYFDNIEACRVLLASGADPHHANARGIHAIDMAISHGHHECAALMLTFVERALLTSAIPEHSSTSMKPPSQSPPRL